MTRQISTDELARILENHAKWLTDADGIRANLSKVDLSYVNLRGANLCGADLSETNLYKVNLCKVNLRGANLYRTNLRATDLREADLSGAILFEADLSDANLRGANLYEADLRGANLHESDLRDTNLCEANLRGANLYGADLRGANLYGTDLRNTIAMLQCPEEGSFIGFKKADDMIVKLRIMENAKRSSATSRKCRCSAAEVLSITDLEGRDTGVKSVRSDYNHNFIYEIGKIVSVDYFDDDRWDECSAGIHFFMTREEAVKYITL